MGELYRQFIERDDITVHKWHHYFPVYERHLGPFVGKAPKMLEIGVQNGGSARMFADWLGDGAIVTGIDIDPQTAAHTIPGRIDIVVGDQADRGFLSRLAAAHGPWNIVIDDGGHTDNQVLTSFDALFPHLLDGGIYVIEDTHAHWLHPRFRDHPEGRSVLDLIAELFTAMHAWTSQDGQWKKWHVPPPDRPKPAEVPYLARHVAALHLYDSMVVIEKCRREEPFSEYRSSGVPRATAYRLPGAAD